MSRFSPTVQVHALDLGDALSAGADSYLQMKQLQNQKDLEAFQTGFGAKLPQPQAATPNAPMSIMATAAPVPNTQTAPSAPLPGVGGLPSPGRVQGMNMPSGAQPTSDLGPALQTGQQRMINGVAQPHDDLRDAIANVGKQVNTDSQPIMSLAGQSYTPPPSAPAFNPYDPNGMVTLPSGKQVQYGMTGFGQRMQAAQMENLVKRADMQKSLSAAGESDALATLHQKEGDPQFLQAKSQADADGKFADALTLEIQKNNMSYDSAAKLAKLHGGIASQLLDQRLSGEAANQQPYDFVTGTDSATGKPMIERGNKKTGTLEPTGVEGKLPAGKAVDATTKMANDHYAAAKEASDALDKLGGTIAQRGQIGNFIAGHNPLDSSLQEANQAGDEFAALMAPILNKGRTTAVEVELVRKAYVPLASDNAATVARKSQQRALLLKQYAPQIQAAAGGTPAATPSQTPSQLWDAAVKLHGEAKVVQEYGPRPAE